MKPPFTSMQEMYNYAANQLIVQKLSQETVKQNVMEHGVTDADAEIVIQNLMIEIEKNKSTQGDSHSAAAATPAHSAAAANPSQSTYGSFANLQEMYNYAAKQLITEKQTQETTKRNLLNHGITEAQADEVIKNMMVEIQKTKPKEGNTKRSEGQKMMLVGLVIAVVGLILFGTKFNIAGQSYAISYGIMIIGAVLFFRGLFKMF